MPGTFTVRAGAGLGFAGTARENGVMVMPSATSGGTSATMGVSHRTGAMARTRRPLAANSRAAPHVMAAIAPLAAT
ncbi:MAG: hypothetical protein LW715_09080 [Rhodobacter sp.]|nr:hypothetical protein [Rhodobacter sp.]